MRNSPDHWYVFHEMPDGLSVREKGDMTARIVSDFDSELVSRVQYGNVWFYRPVRHQSASYGV